MTAVVWRLTPDRAAEWRAIRLEALRIAPQSYGSRLETWRDRPLADFAEHLASAPSFAAGEVVGRPLAIACWHADCDDPRRAWLISVYATAPARGRGYTDALLHHIIADAREAGMVDLWLHVGVRNDAARRLYGRHGFIAADTPPVLNDNGVPEMAMHRAL